MTITFDKILTTNKEFQEVDRTNPSNVAALFVHLMCNYDNTNQEKFYDILQYLVGEYQQISALMKQNIKDRMSQNAKYPYIGKSYFKGATPDNDYTPSTPYEVEVTENDYSNIEEGYKRLFLKSGGADSLRSITLRLAKDGNYYVWSDSFMGLLADIRNPESKNPWA